ncbi:hypothetical protein Bca52824_018174 [Brassica carinata]|uniref:Uncharacterized protein n=1 Tax=Brassica carinata TaxID=52824 RepID=A0A8X8AY67_BRACI|nr:hypothetical protein Bca52824_018174 [Brassica carinata]
MLKQDDPKAKEDMSSSVGGEETAMVKFSEKASMDEANPSTIDKSVAPGTEQVPEMQMKAKKTRIMKIRMSEKNTRNPEKKRRTPKKEELK